MNMSLLILINFVLLAALSKETMATATNCYSQNTLGAVECSSECSEDGGASGNCLAISSTADMTNILLRGCECNSNPWCSVGTEIEGRTNCRLSFQNAYAYCCTTDNCNAPGDTSITCVAANTTADNTTARPNSASKNSLGVFIHVASSLLISYSLF